MKENICLSLLINHSISIYKTGSGKCLLINYSISIYKIPNKRVIESEFFLVTKGLYLWLVSEIPNKKRKDQRCSHCSWREDNWWILILMLTCVFTDGKTFQNRRVSSPAPVTIVCNKAISLELVKNRNFSVSKQECMRSKTSSYRKWCNTWPSGDIAR